MARPFILALAGIVSVGLAGCGYGPVVPAPPPTLTPSPDNTLERREVEEALPHRLDCGSEPVQIVEPAMQVALTGNCPRVEIYSESVIVTVEEAGELMVDAYGAIVLAGSIGSVELSPDASGSLIQWETGRPQVKNESESSVLRRVQ